METTGGFTFNSMHSDIVHDSQMNFCGTKLATCSSDCTIHIYDVGNDKVTHSTTLRGHTGPVWQLGWAHPSFGSFLASCSFDRKVIIWEENSVGWSECFCSNIHKSSVNTVAWGPSEFGKILAAGSMDGCISIISNNNNKWDSVVISDAHTIGCLSISWGPAYIWKDDETGDQVKQFVSGGADGVVKIWRMREKKWVQDDKLEAHTDYVRSVAWAPDIGLYSSTIVSGSQDGKVIVWKKDSTHSTKWEANLLCDQKPDPIWHLSWSFTGIVLAVSSGDNNVTLWKETLRGEWIRITDADKINAEAQKQMFSTVVKHPSNPSVVSS